MWQVVAVVIKLTSILSVRYLDATMALLDLGNQIIARPNNSLSTEGGLKVLAVLLVLVLMVAVGFVKIGAWLVLPFAGLELLGFACAFYYVHLHANDFESITIDDENVVVEKRIRQETTSTVFQRYWAKITIRPVVLEGGIHAKNGLFIGSHGKEVEFGQHLISDEQRTQLARQLKDKIKNI